MAVNYNDKRFTQVKTEEAKALQQANNTYNTMINNSDKYYNDMIKAADDYGQQQQQIQQANTDFAIEKIEQQKDQAAKDYTREQKGAYSDWQKQSDQYGVRAEQIASMGLSGSGYSESSQVGMYNAYQNRISQARDTYSRAVLEYDNGIKEAQLANNAKLAEIAYNSLQNKLELGLNQFQYKNNLLTQQLQLQNDISDRYYKRWSDVLSQINTENALAEQIRQYNANLAEEKRQFNEQMALQKKKLSSGGSGGSGGVPRITGDNPKGDNPTIDKDNPKGAINPVTGKPIPEAKLLKSTMSPELFMSPKAKTFYKNTIGNKPVSAERLMDTIDRGVQLGVFDDDDIGLIAQAYGLKSDEFKKLVPQKAKKIDKKVYKISTKKKKK